MEHISGEISGMAFGGLGILRHEGQVLFVPYTAVGDQIRCRIVRKHKNYSEAKLLAVDVPSPLRTIPKCPYFGTCGGCQLQHLDEAGQLAYKQQSVVDALTRIGKLSNVVVDPIISTQKRWAYRRHITLTLKEERGFFTSGYIADDHRSFLAVTQCPIFLDSSVQVLQKVQELAGSLEAAPGNEGKLVIHKLSVGYFLQFHFKELPKNGLIIIQNALTNNPEWMGSSISTPQKTYQLSQRELSLDIEGLTIHFSPRAFIQNHPEQSLNIYRMIQKIAEGSSKVLDFYCGIGIASLLLARQGKKVIGVENNREAVKMARENGIRNGCNQLSFICEDVKKVVKNLLEKELPDLVIVNPPRVGLEREVVEAFSGKLPHTLLYISCMPATLARDLKVLVAQGYRLEKCQPFDMFPQTGHVETVAVLVS